MRLQGAGRGLQGGRVAGTQRRRDDSRGRRTLRSERTASHYKSRGAGSGPSAPAPRRRGSMSRGAERGAARGASRRAGASSIFGAPGPRSRQEGLGPRRGRWTRTGLCVRGGRRDPLCAQLLDPAGAAVPAEESQRGRRAVRTL